MCALLDEQFQPLLEPAGAPDVAALRKIFSDYRSTLAEERRLLLDRYRFVDATRLCGTTRALADFALRYADQTAKDHAASARRSRRAW